MNTSFQINFFIFSCPHLLWWKSSVPNFCSIISKSTQEWEVVTFQFLSSVDNVRRIKIHNIITGYNIRIDQPNEFSERIFEQVPNLVRPYEEYVEAKKTALTWVWRHWRPHRYPRSIWYAPYDIGYIIWSEDIGVAANDVRPKLSCFFSFYILLIWAIRSLTA